MYSQVVVLLYYVTMVLAQDTISKLDIIKAKLNMTNSRSDQQQINDQYIARQGDMCTNQCSKSDPDAWCGVYKEDSDGNLLRCAEFTRYGDVCVDECGSSGATWYSKGSNWCLTNIYTLETRKYTENCALPGYTINREPCKDRCDTYSESYYWCHTEKSWDYCSPPGRVVPVQHTYQGALCLTECAQRGKNYRWCYKSRRYCDEVCDEKNNCREDCDSNWDYCSEDENHDRYNYKCKEPCSRKGSSYYWCDKEVEGGWDYCSPKFRLGVQYSDHVEVTRYGRRCRDKCSLGGEKYYWCKMYGVHRNSYWEYCSPQKRTIYGERCNDQCAKRGSSYFWCKTDSSWDYCSPEFVPGEGIIGGGQRIEQETRMVFAVVIITTFYYINFVN